MLFCRADPEVPALLVIKDSGEETR
jgi:hypothetical protein